MASLAAPFGPPLSETERVEITLTADAGGEDIMDQGSRPTHKGDIIRLYKQGLEPPDIARQAHHSLKSVERYLKDYERVRMLLKQKLRVEEISAIIGGGQSVIKEYIAQAQLFHPELFERGFRHMSQS